MKNRMRFFLIFITFSIYSFGQCDTCNIQSTKVTGYCFFELAVDSVTNCYYVQNKFFYGNDIKYSIIERRNLIALKNDCLLQDSLLTKAIKMETFFNPFDSLFANRIDEFQQNFLTGEFYTKRRLTTRLFIVYKIAGRATIVKNACNKYKTNYAVNNYPGRGESFCPDYEEMPQIYFLDDLYRDLKIKKIRRTQKLKKSKLKTIQVCNCI